MANSASLSQTISTKPYPAGSPAPLRQIVTFLTSPNLVKSCSNSYSSVPSGKFATNISISPPCYLVDLSFEFCVGRSRNAACPSCSSIFWTSLSRKRTQRELNRTHGRRPWLIQWYAVPEEMPKRSANSRTVSNRSIWESCQKKHAKLQNYEI